MKLETQVVSLELSKKLKELGVKQNALWAYTKDGRLILTYGEGMRVLISAFTVSELGEMLPEICIEGEKKVAGKWNIDSFTADTEADARAKMLIYLLESNLIPLTSLKK